MSVAVGLILYALVSLLLGIFIGKVISKGRS